MKSFISLSEIVPYLSLFLHPEITSEFTSKALWVQILCNMNLYSSRSVLGEDTLKVKNPCLATSKNSYEVCAVSQVLKGLFSTSVVLLQDRDSNPEICFLGELGRMVNWAMKIIMRSWQPIVFLSSQGSPKLYFFCPACL